VLAAPPGSLAKLSSLYHAVTDAYAVHMHEIKPGEIYRDAPEPPSASMADASPPFAA
jgi:hypothetical protein